MSSDKMIAQRMNNLGACLFNDRHEDEALDLFQGALCLMVKETTSTTAMTAEEHPSTQPQVAKAHLLLQQFENAKTPTMKFCLCHNDDTLFRQAFLMPGDISGIKNCPDEGRSKLIARLESLIAESCGAKSVTR